MRTPTGLRQHDVAHGVTRLVGRDHLAHAFARHHPADTRWLRIGFAVVHAAAHVRIERQVEHAQQ